MRKYPLFAIFAFLLIAPVALQSVHATSATDSWYPGKGLKQGDYFSYNVCWTDWHNCAPIQLSFWVKNETSDGSGWNVVLLAVDGSIVQKGVMTIGKITPDPTSFDSNISDYAGVYRSTISWLDSFATADTPKTFNIPWGRTGSVGGQSVAPIDHEKVTVGAGTFDTYVLGWHKDIDNKIWVDSSVPFPVKALVYVDVTTGSPPPDISLELLKLGNSPTEPSILDVSSTATTTVSSQCEAPDMQQDSVHATTTTDTSSLVVDYRYSPSNPHIGCPIEYRISFEQNYDQSQKVSNTQYDIFTTDDQGKQLSSVAQSTGRTSLFAPVGDDDVTTTLQGTTPLTHVVIAMLGTGSDGSLPDVSMAGLVKFDVKTQPAFGGSSAVQTNQTATSENNTSMNTTAAVPEFPLGSLMVMAIVIGLGVLFVRITPGLSITRL